MSKRIYAVSATRELFLEDHAFIIMALKIEGLGDCEADYDEMHHGDAPGGDQFLAGVFNGWGYRVKEHPADWQVYGRKAGPIRNREMLDKAKPQTLLAFPAKASGRRPRSKGTLDCIQAALDRDIDVKVWWLV